MITESLELELISLSGRFERQIIPEKEKMQSEKKRKTRRKKKYFGIGKKKMMTGISFLSFGIYFLFSIVFLFTIFTKIMNINLVENKK